MLLLTFLCLKRLSLFENNHWKRPPNFYRTLFTNILVHNANAVLDITHTCTNLVTPFQDIILSTLQPVVNVQKLNDSMLFDMISVFFSLVPRKRWSKRQKAHYQPEIYEINNKDISKFCKHTGNPGVLKKRNTFSQELILCKLLKQQTNFKNSQSVQWLSIVIVIESRNINLKLYKLFGGPPFTLSYYIQPELKLKSFEWSDFTAPFLE